MRCQNAAIDCMKEMKITASDIRSMVRECVERILNEEAGVPKEYERLAVYIIEKMFHHLADGAYFKLSQSKKTPGKPLARVGGNIHFEMEMNVDELKEFDPKGRLSQVMPTGLKVMTFERDGGGERASITIGENDSPTLIRIKIPKSWQHLPIGTTNFETYKKNYITSLMHELTHGLNAGHYCDVEHDIYRRKNTWDNFLPGYGFGNSQTTNYIYAFTPGELNARVGEFYYSLRCPADIDTPEKLKDEIKMSVKYLEQTKLDYDKRSPQFKAYYPKLIYSFDSWLPSMQTCIENVLKTTYDRYLNTQKHQNLSDAVSVYLTYPDSIINKRKYRIGFKRVEYRAGDILLPNEEGEKLLGKPYEKNGEVVKRNDGYKIGYSRLIKDEASFEKVKQMLVADLTEIMAKYQRRLEKVLITFYHDTLEKMTEQQ